MLSPTPAGLGRCGVATFSTVRSDTWPIGTVAASVSETEPVGAVPVPVASFRTEPALRSAWVRTYVAVQVIAAPGASVAGWAGRHDSTGSSESVTVTPVNVTFPSLVATI